MKSLVSAIAILIILHVLAASGFAMWLGFSDRLSGERMRRAVAIFDLPIAQEQALAAEQRLSDELEAEARREAARLDAAAAGPQTLQQRLETQQLDRDINNAMLDRLRREAEDIRRRWESDKALIAKLKAELDTEREKFERYVAQHTDLAQDASFNQTVAMYEQLKAKQAKAMFQQMIASGNTDDVVAYLAAMSPRKAGAILREFKDGPDIAVAAQLLEQLRNRGTNPLSSSQRQEGGRS